MLISIASWASADISEISNLLTKYKRDSRLQNSPFYDLFLHWVKHTKVVEDMQKEMKSLQHQINELRNLHGKWDEFFGIERTNISQRCDANPTVKLFFLLLTKMDETTKNINSLKLWTDTKEKELITPMQLQNQSNEKIDVMKEKISGLQKNNLELRMNLTKSEEMLVETSSCCQKLNDKITKLEKKLDDSVRKLDKTNSNLKRDIAEISKKDLDTRANVTLAWTNKIKTIESKVSNLQIKQTSAERKITTDVEKLQKEDRITAGKITKISTRIINMQASLQNQISNNKCESGIVIMKSAYSTKVNMVSDQNVRFARPFLRKPNIVFGLALYDSSHTTNDRLKSYRTRLDRYGFTLRISAWGGTILYQAHYFWMACP